MSIADHPTYPALDLVYARASLLSAEIDPWALGQPIGVVDATMLKGLFGNKAKKLVRRWAPLFVHNALHDPEFPQEKAIIEALERAEARLKSVAELSWFIAFRDAAVAGVAPASFVRTIPADRQKRLYAERRQWAAAGADLEKMFETGFLAVRDAMQRYISAVPVNEHAVSLKKLSKFTPKVA